MNKLTETEIAADGTDNDKNIIWFTDKTEKTHITQKRLFQIPLGPSWLKTMWTVTKVWTQCFKWYGHLRKVQIRMCLSVNYACISYCVSFSYHVIIYSHSVDP